MLLGRSVAAVPAADRITDGGAEVDEHQLWASISRRPLREPPGTTKKIRVSQKKNEERGQGRPKFFRYNFDLHFRFDSEEQFFHTWILCTDGGRVCASPEHQQRN